MGKILVVQKNVKACTVPTRTQKKKRKVVKKKLLAIRATANWV
tara:strand:- start:902 stop:1030 length:129 start_codon:yes stop_codon:yes gene_type:complete